ncbi:endonuclease Q family protein [Agriterribacter sp.]|uniref:endonuclease Q family protein n=1 Tax=Agriterribacter sp. TaxID=2821509 RepID=UPI002CE39C43|nr:endonuclease Q family protein [Agriterribacter sp.]HRO48078.1 endonuclease Q family protein [Agriterribacter sp.]HRQ16104.1 endonuclease Q family protein [Agriterribacter sp.]
MLMFFIADLHTHSHYAGATSKFLCLETMYQWALIKGIDVVGTGDFTHPAWIKELEEKLQPAGNGFFTLKQLPELTVLPGARPQGRTVNFCLSTEVNCEYVVNGRQYKNHHLIYAPDFETAHRINKALAPYGDLSSDGRPTLLLPAHELLKIVLDISLRAFFVPAHIWTPWFSTLGSKNGHDSLKDCFKDVTHELFAVETSLSADPLMCRRYTELDGLTLLSNSDAHSAHKLGREVNLLDTALSYDAMFTAIKTKQGFTGTWEYYPQRGKYFNDGHRKCNISFGTEETPPAICPVCQKPLTIGVAHRVEQLANRDEQEAARQVQPFKYVLPLPEILSEITGVGESSLKVTAMYAKAIAHFGSEFNILHQAPVEDIHRYHPKLSVAIDRLRQNKKHFTAGYDGAHGRVWFFEKAELNTKPEQMLLF